MTHRFLTVAMACAMVLSLSACGDEVEPPRVPTSEDLCKGATGGGPKVGMAYDVGGRDDRGLNDLAFAGLSRAVRAFKATCIEGEAVEGELEQARVDRLRHLADTGATTIVAIGSRYNEAVNDVSDLYPRVRFAVIDGEDPDKVPNRNVAYLNFAVAEGSYLVGAAAALTSKSGTVGFVGRGDSSPVESSEPYELGFTAGAKAANPEVKVLVTGIQPDSRDPEVPTDAEVAATAQYEAGADVVFGAPGITEADLFDAAIEAGDEAWAIGVGTDQFPIASEDRQPHVLTSMVKRYDTLTYEFIASVARHRPLAGPRTFGVESNGVGYATSGDFLKPIVSQIDEFKAQIIAGEVRVPSRR